MKTEVVEAEYGDSMDIYSDKVMFFEAPSDCDYLAEQLIEKAANELDGDGQTIENVFKNIKYLYSIHDVVCVDEEDYFKALSIKRTDSCRNTYYLNTESMDEKGLKLIVQVNGILSREDNLSLLEKDMADIQSGMIEEEDYAFYNYSEKLLSQYIAIKKGSEKESMALSVFTPGDIFEDCDGMEYILCEHFSYGTVGVITRDTVEVMEFGKNNNWTDSNHRGYLNGQFLEELKRKFGEDSIDIHKVDLLSLDGCDDYGSTLDNVSELTLDRFRKYRKYVGNCPKAYSLSTPNSTPSGCDNPEIEYIGENNAVGSIGCCEMLGLRPFFVIKSSVLVIPVIESESGDSV